MNATKTAIPETSSTVSSACARRADEYAQLAVRPAPGESRLVFASDPTGAAAEQYRLIRHRLVEAYPDGAAMVITSPEAGEGKTLTSANLAWALGEAGMPTLLAEMDFRSPSLARLLGYSPQIASMSSLLSDGDVGKGTVYQVNGMPLYVATCDAPRNPTGVLTGPRVSRFLAWAKQRYKWIVLDAPPLLRFSDATELSAAADFTILVVRAGMSSRALVTRSIELLGPRLQQIILNEATKCVDSPYPYRPTLYGARKQQPKG